jgi:hypothetical protein
MNDFTKQELIDLHDLCYGGIHDDHPVEDWKLSLQVKIKSMIDNYCEWDINQCPNCGKIL